LINQPIAEALYSNMTVALLYGVVFMILSNKMMLENEVSLGSRLMESLFEESPSAIFFIDQTNDRIVKVNDKTLRMFNVGNGITLVGESIQKLLGYDYKQNLRTGHEIEITNFTGDKLWADISWQKIN